MNDDAEAWIANWYANSGDGLQSVTDVIREAMRWAYADAAKICRETSGNEPSGHGGRFGAIDCAEAIEARAK